MLLVQHARGLGVVGMLFPHDSRRSRTSLLGALGKLATRSTASVYGVCPDCVWSYGRARGNPQLKGCLGDFMPWASFSCCAGIFARTALVGRSLLESLLGVLSPCRILRRAVTRTCHWRSREWKQGYPGYEIAYKMRFPQTSRTCPAHFVFSVPYIVC